MQLLQRSGLPVLRSKTSAIQSKFRAVSALEQNGISYKAGFTAVETGDAIERLEDSTLPATANFTRASLLFFRPSHVRPRDDCPLNLFLQSVGEQLRPGLYLKGIRPTRRK